MKDGISKCRKCGKMIGIITYGIYRKSVVDAETVNVVPDENGETFVRIDGSKMLGKEIPFEEFYGEKAYRLHRTSCGG